MKHLDVAATTRASFYVYTTKADIDQLIDGLNKANKIFGLA
jgi:cysteine desulfurase/selenocysteine lyase